MRRSLRKTHCDPILNIHVGICDPYLYTHWSVPRVGDRTHYFDSSGRLVAAVFGSDTTEFCNRTAWVVVYGDEPACRMHLTEQICPRP
jgi:hypothetical protein